MSSAKPILSETFLKIRQIRHCYPWWENQSEITTRWIFKNFSTSQISFLKNIISSVILYFLPRDDYFNFSLFLPFRTTIFSATSTNYGTKLPRNSSEKTIWANAKNQLHRALISSEWRNLSDQDITGSTPTVDQMKTLLLFTVTPSTTKHVSTPKHQRWRTENITREKKKLSGPRKSSMRNQE